MGITEQKNGQKEREIAHKKDLGRNSVCSEQNIYPSPEKFRTNAACTTHNIWKVCLDPTRFLTAPFLQEL